jgi:hypothetical protein
MKTLQTNSGSFSKVIPGDRIFIIVVIILIAPIRDEKPARCRLYMERSTDTPIWKGVSDYGGYTVQPVPAPPAYRPVVY